jgi:hypothetical protein
LLLMPVPRMANRLVKVDLRGLRFNGNGCRIFDLIVVILNSGTVNVWPKMTYM